MKLTLDRRKQFQGQPATHALVVGISLYPHLPLPSRAAAGATPSAPPSPPPAPTDSGYGAEDLVTLNFATRSAYVFADWLVQNADRLAVPLATCRVLYAPSEAEVTNLPQLKEQRCPCGVTDFVEAASAWRRDALDHSGNMLILYFAGHSLELTQLQPALVFEDFGNNVGPALRATVSLSNLIDGLAPCSWQSDIARTQFLLIDTDRIRVDELTAGIVPRTTDVFDVPRTGSFDDRRCCVLYGSPAGGEAYAVDNYGTLFNLALMKCLQGTAATPAALDPSGGPTTWQITTRSLLHGVQTELDQLNQQAQISPPQRIDWILRGEDATLVHIDQPPPVEVQLRIEPNTCLNQARVDVRDEKLDTVFHWDAQAGGIKADPGHGLVVELPAGIYQIQVKVGPDASPRSWEKFVRVIPPRVELTARFDS